MEHINPATGMKIEFVTGILSQILGFGFKSAFKMY